MKKLFLVLSLLMLAVFCQAQSIWKPVPVDLFKAINGNLKAGTAPVTGTWIWRFEANVNLAGYQWDKATKSLVPMSCVGVGPGVGYKHYIPTSATDPTPYENYGFGAAVLFGADINNPDLSKLMIAVEADLFQYLKFGISIAPNATDHFGIFLGTGITF